MASTAKTGAQLGIIGSLLENHHVKTGQYMQHPDFGCIKIISVPPGEAPYWVREKWVGLYLPLAAPGMWNSKGFGVLTRPKTWLGQLIALRLGKYTTTVGYRVNSAAAVQILEFHHPEAASWWRRNAASALAPGQAFLFSKECCEKPGPLPPLWPPPIS
jgi:hypothetical protein